MHECVSGMSEYVFVCLKERGRDREWKRRIKEILGGKIDILLLQREAGELHWF